MLAAVAGVLAAFGSFLVLAVIVGATSIALIGMPLDLAPQDWHRLATVIALGAALVSLLAYLFGGYVAARLGGRDGLQHGLRVFALAVLVLGVLGLLLLGMAGPVSTEAGWSDVLAGCRRRRARTARTYASRSLGPKAPRSSRRLPTGPVWDRLALDSRCGN